ncbi:PH and SEC7 domain-containing protein isoform X3 [Calliphora vicina]|uniref:PH and SEC7 domain-containing protein isoform X3 n=1 Tax=Calliphora vicina TaxID=7373 RepID=UPI00325B4750
MSTEELKVVLRRSSEYSGFGFSLLGTTGPPHVIYDIVENSPAADCGVVEAGDVILKVNGTDVHRYTTKEVLKCLRLSEDLVTLELKRDPKLKARIKEQLANTKSPHYIDIETTNNYDYHHSRTSSPHHHHQQQQHHEAANKLHYDTTHNYTTIQQQQQSPTSSSPAATRYKSTTTATSAATNLPQRQQSSNTTNHSRSSSASSAKIQLVEGLGGGGGGGGGGSGAGTGTSTTATSPTSRPSRIPQALKCPSQKSQQSPQHKRPRPSQIPTKASLAAAAAAAAAATSTITTTATTTNGTSFMVGSNNLQHSFSYSGNTTRQAGKSSSSSYAAEEREPEPNSAPPQPTKAPRFEAYMMTGDLILNLSRTPQNSNLLPVQAKKVDSLRDSPNRAAVARANGALAPKASGESSPTSSSSQESPTHSTDSAELQNKAKARLRKHQQAQAQQDREQEQQQQQYQRDSINNSYNNRKDSLTNDTLLLCEELEKDDEDVGDDDDEGDVHRNRPHHHHHPHHKTKHQHYMQKHKQHCYQQQTRQQQQQNKSYEYYQNEDEEPDEEYDRYAGEEEEEENEEDQTNYDITNLETYNSGGGGGGGGVGSMAISGQADDEASDRQCLMQYGDEDDDEQAEDEEYSNSVASASAKQRLKALKKQKAALRYKQQRNSQDNVDCPRNQRSSASSTSSTTVGNTGAANTSQDETSFSVPTSPISLSTPLIDKETANSVPTSPEPSNLAGGSGVGGPDSSAVVRRHNGQMVRKCDSAGFRTSKSEDHLQQIQREGMGAVIPIDIDEDVNSSLNTLLDTRQDSEDSQASDRDRIVWTYNAPLQPHQLAALQQQQQQQQQQQYSTNYGSNNSHNHSHSSSISSSPHHSAGSPASPTSVSSSVMSSSGSKGALGIGGNFTNNNGHNYQQQQQQQQQYQQYNVVVTNGGMILSDPSDSDSTILVSDAAVQRQQQQQQQRHHQQQQQKSSEHKVVIQVRGADNAANSHNSHNNNGSSMRSLGSEHKNSEDELATLAEDAAAPMHQQSTSPNSNSGTLGDGRESSPPVSDDGSDVESLHSYHYSPKAVDMPSAIRLAKRLYTLDGFKKSDVSRHLSKNNDFNRAVADEYLKYFSFETKTLDQSLREFLQQFSLSGETQERERVLVHFSKRYLDCNPGTFNSQDAVHTLTCAIMLLNTDLHGQNIGRKMTCNEFIENLAELNDGESFPKDVLKYLYQAIKSQPLEWALDEDPSDLQKLQGDNKNLQQNSGQLGQNPFLDIPEAANAVEYKKGYVMRKCCYDVNYKKTPFGKRSWKMFYCTLRDLVLYLHKDEHGFRKSQMSDNVHNAIRIHHALATKATDYTKKQHVFRLQTADQAEYLFQTSDSKELQSWVETINFVCAAYSAPPLEGGVGSQKRFQRPLLPSSHTKLLLKEQLESHEQQLNKLENTILEHKKGPIPSKGLALQNYKEKELFLQYEVRRYKAYVSILTAKLLADQQQFELQQCNQLNEEDTDKFFKTQVVATQPICLQPMPTSSAAPNSINANEQQLQLQQQQQLQQSSQSQPQLQQQQQQQQPAAASGNRWYGCGSFAWWSCLFS